MTTERIRKSLEMSLNALGHPEAIDKMIGCLLHLEKQKTVYRVDIRQFVEKGFPLFAFFNQKFGYVYDRWGTAIGSNFLQILSDDKFEYEDFIEGLVSLGEEGGMFYEEGE